jgi:hypothetical protein
MAESVRFIDTIRNAVVHNGRLPRPAEGKNPHPTRPASRRHRLYCFPEITCQALYRIFEFTIDRRGQLDSRGDDAGILHGRPPWGEH